MNTYKITKLVAGSPGSINIDEKTFNEIKDARSNLFQTLFIEEKLDFIIENYFEFENELLAAASRMMIYNDDDYFSMSKDRNIVSRRIVNLLSASRMYLDSSIHHLNNIYGKKTYIPETVESLKNSSYDSSIGYRIMEALRNYIQHRGFPIHSIIFNYRRVGEDHNTELLFSVTPFIKVSSIEDDKGFKVSVLEDLKNIQIKDQIDVKPIIREYIENIGNIHEKIRELISKDVNNWEDIFDKTIEKYKDKFGKDSNIAGLSIIKMDENNKTIEKYSLFKDFIEKRIDLESKNRNFNNLHKCFVTNQVISKNT